MNACPALFITAPASGQGKTTVTAALARYHRQRGRRVRVFKTGPDFLDPMILECASGQPVYTLDLFMGGEAHCRELLWQAAGDADLILIEGVMGLFDGQPCSADLAALFGIPIMAVINASAMAQTFGAIAHGLATYRPELPFAGVFANQIAGQRHYAMLAESLAGIPVLGWLARDAGQALPERHLGLYQASEINDLDARIEQAAAALNDLPAELPAPIRFAAPEPHQHPALLAGVRIAVARDAAFAFVYRANLDLLQALGAELHEFSPLNDSQLPPADALYLPGGYPELHLHRLAANQTLHQAIRDHHHAGKPIVAECGGLLYLCELLTDVNGLQGTLCGIVPGHARMQPRLASLGLYRARLPEGELRGHSFHYSTLDSPLTPIATTEGITHSTPGEPIYRQGRLHASYMHHYFASNPQATAMLFKPGLLQPG